MNIRIFLVVLLYSLIIVMVISMGIHDDIWLTDTKDTTTEEITQFN